MEKTIRIQIWIWIYIFPPKGDVYIDMYIQIYAIYNHIPVDMSNFKHTYLPTSVLIDTNYKIRQDALHTAFQPDTFIFI